MKTFKAAPLTTEAFAPFGDVLNVEGEPDRLINQDLCGRYHDRAKIDIEGGDVGISLFKAEARSLPYTLDLLERHPLGSQAFLPMSMDAFLVIVAPDAGGAPGDPLAFLTQPGEGINLHRGTWHGVLTPLSEPGLFAVIDYVGDAPNLEEHTLKAPVLITG